MKRLLKCAGMLIAGILLGTLAMCLVYLLPVQPMQEHMTESLESFMEEGDNPFLIEGLKGSSLDNTTDAIMLGTAVYQSDRPFYQSAMLVAWHLNDLESMDALEEYLTEGNTEGESCYPRYWHGYLVLLKPLLLFLNFGQIRILNGVIMVILMATILWRLWRRGLWRVMVAYVLSLLALYPMTIPYSLQFSTCFYVGNAALLLALLYFERWEERDAWPYFFLITGMCTSFVDFLTYPLYTFGMAFVLCMALRKDSARGELRFLIRGGVAWCAGYLGMWAGKWCMATLLTEENVFADALVSVSARTALEAYDEKISRIMTVLRNFYMYANIWGILLTVAVIVWLCCSLRGQKLKSLLPQIWRLVAVACLPLLWYVLAANHSYIHYWYTFRDLAFSVFAISLIPEFLQGKAVRT
ncbi:MAG: hypothetical protein LIO86_02865 [Lachnospiraceae bacterium]|nr:hypothetical protein [Lachnospiraceae bacterium]